MLFGDELQVHVTAIQALNQIIHTAVSHKSGSSSSSKHSWRQKQNKPFFRQRPVPAQMEAKTVEEKGKRSSGQEQVIITSEISSLLEKAVIVESTHEPGEFISSVFVRPKKGGSHRMIFYLKNLNKHVQYNHFKMDTL